MRFTLLVLALGMASAQSPRFDVASVKALPNEQHGAGFQVTPNGVAFHGYPLGFLIRWAYGLHINQAFETAGPSWLEPGLGCMRFEIQAKTDHPVTVDELRLMLRTLLAERLKVTLHRETKEMIAAVLAVAKDGPKLRPSDQDEMTVKVDAGVLHFQGATLARLDEWLYQYVPYLILDETKLTGRYDFALNIEQYRDLSVEGPNGRSDDTPAINKALQSLGLKLEEKKRSVEILVVDHAEKFPTDN